MHRYRTVVQISFILSILNFVLAAPAPIVVWEIHRARGDDMVVAENVPLMPRKLDEEEVASDRPTSPASSTDSVASAQHESLSDGSTASSGYLAHLPSGAESPGEGYLWLVSRPPRLSLNLPSSSASLPSSSAPPEIPPPSPALSQESGSLHPSQVSTPEWLQELEHQFEQEISPPSLHLSGSTWVTTETSGKFTPHHPSSASSTDWHNPESMSAQYLSAPGGSLSLPHFSPSDGSVPPHDLVSMPERLAPSLTPDEPPTETPPLADNHDAEFFNKNMMKKLKIAAGVIIVGGTIASIAGSHIKHQHRDYQDSRPSRFKGQIS